MTPNDEIRRHNRRLLKRWANHLADRDAVPLVCLGHMEGDAEKVYVCIPDDVTERDVIRSLREAADLMEKQRDESLKAKYRDN